MKTILFSFAFSFCICSFAQKNKNLVPNPSFEIHKGKATGDIKLAIPWTGEGTVDFYPKTEKKDTSKYKGPHSGKCYAGLRFQSSYKEYMFTALTEPLQKERTYRFKMYVRLLGASTVIIKQLGVYLSDEAFKVGMSFKEEGIIDSTYKKGISGVGWIAIQGEYIAHGGEKYIIIGNFTTNMKKDFVAINKWGIFEFKEAYYYIDDVSLIKVPIPSDTDPTLKKIVKKDTYSIPDSFATGQIVEIKDLQFEKGTAKFLKTSYKILDEAVRVVNNHPFMEIQINGHVSNEGDESKNKKLSKERAKAVHDYLLSHGIISPMTYKGFGSALPIAPNDTDQNKAKNDRIEIMVIKE